MKGTNVEIISDDQHWCITASTLTLDLDHRELAVLRRVSRLDAAKVLTNGVQKLRGATKHAWGGRADLYKVLTDGFTFGGEGTSLSVRVKRCEFQGHSYRVTNTDLLNMV